MTSQESQRYPNLVIATKHIHEMQEAKASILRSDMAETQEVRVLVNEEGGKNFVEVVPNTMVVDEDDIEENEEGSNVDMTDVEITAQKTRQEVLEEKVVDVH